MDTSSGAVTFSILIKKTEEYGYVAHCLELDLVATADTPEAVKADIFDVIVAQVRYAFANDNLEYLYHPAPAEVWKEFYECRDQQIERHPVSKNEEDEKLEKFVPPWIIANTCHSMETCHV
jgi:predicted RNase H-like HicB family nuclease